MILLLFFTPHWQEPTPSPVTPFSPPSGPPVTPLLSPPSGPLVTPLSPPSGPVTPLLSPLGPSSPSPSVGRGPPVGVNSMSSSHSTFMSPAAKQYLLPGWSSFSKMQGDKQFKSMVIPLWS